MKDHFDEIKKRLPNSQAVLRWVKREVYALVALHALLSIPPSQRPPGAAKAAVRAADELIKELEAK